jgi:hypothetical protein
VSALIPEVSPCKEESGIEVLPISVLQRLELEPKGARSELRAAEAGVLSGENVACVPSGEDAVRMPNCEKPVGVLKEGNTADFFISEMAAEESCDDKEPLGGLRQGLFLFRRFWI